MDRHQDYKVILPKLGYLETNWPKITIYLLMKDTEEVVFCMQVAQINQINMQVPKPLKNSFGSLSYNKFSFQKPQNNVIQKAIYIVLYDIDIHGVHCNAYKSICIFNVEKIIRN